MTDTSLSEEVFYQASRILLANAGKASRSFDKLHWKSLSENKNKPSYDALTAHVAIVFYQIHSAADGRTE